MDKKKLKYSDGELKKAIDLVETGYSFSEVIIGTNLNKSIIAREMRKRKNEKAQKKMGSFY